MYRVLSYSQEVLILIKSISNYGYDTYGTTLMVQHFWCPIHVCWVEVLRVALHAISPISIKLYQFEGYIPKLKKANWFLFWLFPGGNRPPLVFLGFHHGNRFKSKEANKWPCFQTLTWCRRHTIRYNRILSQPEIRKQWKQQCDVYCVFYAK